TQQLLLFLGSERQSRLLILFKGGSVDNVESPYQTKHNHQDPNQKVVAQTKGKSSSFCAQPLIHQCHGWA
ncbi:hypothetical protein QW71_36390, partial [Paenibacillus sp. IHB B 3415]